MLADVKPAWCSQNRDAARPFGATWCLDTDLEVIAQESKETQSKLSPQTLAYVMYTPAHRETEGSND